MDAKIRGRFLFIFAVVSVCILGLIWGPTISSVPLNIHQVRENLRSRIRLGLDLRGGSHLVLRVQVEDAVNISTDQTLERLRDELKTKNIPYADIQKTDSTHIVIKGIPQDKSGDFESLISGQFSDWDPGRVAGDALLSLIHI